MALFGTAGIRGPVEEVVTPELALAVGRAAGRDGGRWVVGRDGRVSGPALLDAVVAGLESAGATVERVGRVPTPALAFASRGRRGAMITASHNPPADNGIKLFEDGVEYGSAAERRVASRVESPPAPTPWSEWGASRRGSILHTYREAVVDYASAWFERSPERVEVRVAVDCGGGTAGVATPQILRALGADVRALNADIDGSFTARESKPTAASLTGLRRFVRDDHETALGIGHDGDGDRIVVVDADGAVVHEDTILAILAERYVTGSDADEPVVLTTPNASARIDERVETAGGRVERVGLGRLHEGIRRVESQVDATDPSGDPRVVFAAEPWKHVHPAFGGWIDAVVSAALVCGLVDAAGGLGPLREPIAEPPAEKTSFECPEPAKDGAMAHIRERLPDAVVGATVGTAAGEEGGLRLTWDDGSWLLVRPSGTEPVIRLYAEGGRLEELVSVASEVVREAIDEAAVDVDDG